MVEHEPVTPNVDCDRSAKREPLDNAQLRARGEPELKQSDAPSLDHYDVGIFLGSAKRERDGSPFVILRVVHHHASREYCVMLRHTMPAIDVVIVGGGIAGLGVRAALAEHGLQTTLVDPAGLFAKSSGNSAAIFFDAENDAACAGLIAETRAFAQRVIPRGWARALRQTGVIIAATAESSIEGFKVDARRERDVRFAECERGALAKIRQLLRPEVTFATCDLVDAGILDSAELARSLYIAGNGDVLSQEVTGLLISDSRVCGVKLADETSIRASWTILAGGARATSLAQAHELSLPLRPFRRHLFECAFNDAAVSNSWGDAPLWWIAADGRPEWYARALAPGRLLTSPCDEDDVGTAFEAVSSAVEARMADVLSEHFAQRLEILERRACARTLAPDRLPVVGLDVRVEGLAWLAGLGGRGLTVGLGASSCLAATLAGGPGNAWTGLMSPGRFQ